MRIQQDIFEFGNLQIERTITFGNEIDRHLTIMRFNEAGGYWEVIAPSDPDHHRAIIMMLNQENGN
jgi:hypothetical protein